MGLGHAVCAGEPTQDFGENENQNHADEETGLLGRATDAGVTDDADGKSGGQAGQADRQAGAELDEALVERHDLGEAVRDEHGDDEAVDTDDTGHNDGYDICPHVSLPPNSTPTRVVRVSELL